MLTIWKSKILVHNSFEKGGKFEKYNRHKTCNKFQRLSRISA